MPNLYNRSFRRLEWLLDWLVTVQWVALPAWVFTVLSKTMQQRSHTHVEHDDSYRQKADMVHTQHRAKVLHKHGKWLEDAQQQYAGGVDDELIKSIRRHPVAL